jgi:hypothetical protein
MLNLKFGMYNIRVLEHNKNVLVKFQLTFCQLEQKWGTGNLVCCVTITIIEGHYTTSQKVSGSTPDEVNNFFLQFT